MKTNSLVLKFTIEDLNKFAPKGVRFELGNKQDIKVVPNGFKEKYPHIEQANDVLSTFFTLRDLETEVGQYMDLGNKKIPVGFEQVTADTVFFEKFRQRQDELFPKDGGPQKKNILSKSDVLTIDMTDRISTLDLYGQATNLSDSLYKDLQKLDKKLSDLKQTEPKDNLFNRGKRKKWEKDCSIAYEDKERIKKARKSADASRTNAFYKLSYKPDEILAFAFKQAAKHKIQEVLNEFERIENSDTGDKIKKSISRLQSLGVITTQVESDKNHMVSVFGTGKTKMKEMSGVVHADIIAQTKRAKYHPIFVTRDKRFPEIDDINAKFSELSGKKQLTPAESKLLLEILGAKVRA